MAGSAENSYLTVLHQQLPLGMLFCLMDNTGRLFALRLSNSRSDTGHTLTYKYLAPRTSDTPNVRSTSTQFQLPRIPFAKTYPLLSQRK